MRQDSQTLPAIVRSWDGDEAIRAAISAFLKGDPVEAASFFTANALIEAWLSEPFGSMAAFATSPYMAVGTLGVARFVAALRGNLDIVSFGTCYPTRAVVTGDVRTYSTTHSGVFRCPRDPQQTVDLEATAGWSVNPDSGLIAKIVIRSGTEPLEPEELR